MDEAVREIALDAHATVSLNVEDVLGRLVDAAWAYRFGPPTQDVIALTLERPDGELLSQAFHLPAGRPPDPLSPADLGLRAVVVADPEADAPRLSGLQRPVRLRRADLRRARVRTSPMTPSRCAPGGVREVVLLQAADGDRGDGAAGHDDRREHARRRARPRRRRLARAPSPR